MRLYPSENRVCQVWLAPASVGVLHSSRRGRKKTLVSAAVQFSTSGADKSHVLTRFSHPELSAAALFPENTNTSMSFHGNTKSCKFPNKRHRADGLPDKSTTNSLRVLTDLVSLLESGCLNRTKKLKWACLPVTRPTLTDVRLSNFHRRAEVRVRSGHRC